MASAEVDWIGAGGFESLAPEWDALAAGSPFDLHCWYSAWWKAFGAGSELAVCTLRRDGELVGLFPLRRIRGRLEPMANVHSPSFRPLARDEAAMGDLVAAAMSGSGLELHGVPAVKQLVEQLTVGARDASLVPHVEPTYISPTVDTSGDFDAWRAASKKRWGAPLERFRRKMGRDHEAEFAIVVPPRDLAAELRAGFAVEGSGWKGRQGTAINSSPQTETFYAEVAAEFACRDELRLSRIVLDGDTASFDLTLLHGDRLYLLKTGFDERFRKLAPGLVMRLSIIERCFELGLCSHELLGDESEWKSKFATSARPHVSFWAYRRRPLELARYGYRTALRPHLRSAYRRFKRRGDGKSGGSRAAPPA